MLQNLCRITLPSGVVVEWPQPETSAPPNGTVCFVPNWLFATCTVSNLWSGDQYDFNFLKRGMLHLSEQAAIKHAEALILISGGMCDG